MGLDRIKTHFLSHRHDFVEITLVVAGFGKEIINGIETTMKPGTFTFFMPWHTHEICVIGENPIQLYRCNFGMELILEFINMDNELAKTAFSNLYESPTIQLSPIETQKVVSIFKELNEESGDSNPLKKLWFKTRIADLKEYPQYSFDKNKGYLTKEHMLALQEHGPCPIHRKTYEPIRKLLE